jgi:thioesterase domain-containing protein/NAD(P)-dependent dehydrogenase (short-subunit alcohol dehydrogenase family)/acyl carrier protein
VVSADAAGLGLAPAGHPLLGAALTLPGTGTADGGALLTGRLSLRTHPWLTGHAVLGTVILPGTGLVELAVRAGDQTGSPVLEELVIEAPLPVPDQGAIQLQVAVGAADDSGRRSVTIHSRPEPSGAGDDEPEWSRHASGVLANSSDQQAPSPEPWPPAGVAALDVDDAYPRLESAGLHYGPAFQGLQAAWRDGDRIYAEVELPADQAGAAGAFGIHPALLDAAMHVSAYLGLDETPEGQNRLPFAYRGVRLHAAGARALRVHVRVLGEDEVSIHATDPAGAPVVTIDSLRARLISAAQLATARPAGPDNLYRVEWNELVEGKSGGPVEPTATTSLRVSGSSVVGGTGVVGGSGSREVLLAARSATSEVLRRLQEHLSDEEAGSARLVIITRNAVAATPDDAPDPAAAAVLGLTRAAQAEHPDRILLVDLDADPRSEDHLEPAVTAAIGAAEPQVAIRGGTVLVPRLTRVSLGVLDGVPAPAGREAADPTYRPTGNGTPDISRVAGPGSHPTAWDPDGTVLITGGLGTLGSALARHLVATGRTRHLVLLGRRGEDTPGAADLRADLEAQGATVAVRATDAGDRDALAAVLEAIPDENPLTAVVHAAGVLSDGVITNLTPGDLETVLRAKADAAWNLHELTQDRPPAGFVLYSSVSGLQGAPGQGSYTAANTFLDALAAHRRAKDLAGVSLAWGTWAETSSITEHLEGREGGVRPLPTAEALALFDAALRHSSTESILVPAALKLSRLQTTAVPSLLRGLVRPTRAHVRPSTERAALDVRAQLAGKSRAAQEDILLDLVRAETATALGAGPDSVTAEDSFTGLGLNSLTAVELRNRLNAVTGLRLPATLTFDHPDPTALAVFLREQIETGAQKPEVPIPTEGPLTTLYRGLCAGKAFGPASELIAAASYARTFFGPDTSDRHALAPIRLAEGPGLPLICFPALSALSGPHEYARLGAAFVGERDVWVIPSPGWAASDALPDTDSTYVQMQLKTLENLVGERDFAVVGRSMGGSVAHAVTVALEAKGRPPVGEVLIDAYTLDAPVQEGMRDWWLPSMLGGMLDRIERYELIWSDASLSAMGTYNRIFAGWEPEPVAVPTLVVRANRPLPGTVVDPEGHRDWRVYWPQPHDVTDVPGDHFTVLEEDFQATVDAIRPWVDALSRNRSEQR